MNIVLQQFSGDMFEGNFGRISLLRKYFHRLGGYDEKLGAMGFQDNDLIIRAKTLGLTHIVQPDRRYTSAIANSKAECMLLTDSDKNYYLQICLSI